MPLHNAPVAAALAWLAVLSALPAATAAEADFIATHPPRFWEGREFPGATGAATVDAEHVVHTRFDFSGGGNYVETAFDLKPSQPVSGVTFQAQKPAGYPLTVRVRDASGQCFQKTARHAAAGWTTFRFDMKNWTGSWGGAEDGVLQQPISGFSILVENTHQPNPAGELLLKGIALETDAQVSPTRPSRNYTRYTVSDFGRGEVNAFEHNRFSNNPSGTFDNGLIRADFAKTDHVSIGHSLAILGVPEELILTVEADAAAEGAELELGIGSHFMTFTRTAGQLRAPIKAGQKICQTFVLPAPPAEGWQWHGGANDGKPNYPLRLSFLNVRKGAAKASAFTLRLVSLEANTRLAPAKRLALRTRLEGTPPRAVVGELRNLDDAAHGGRLTVALNTWEGETLETLATNLPALPPGETCRFSLPLPALPAKNFIEGASAFAADGGGLTAEWTAAWTAGLDDAGDAGLRPDLPWGMGVYLYRNGWNEEGYRNMDRVASLAQAAGVKWTREEFQWHRMEPKRGQYDFAFYDRLVETAQRHGLSVYALVGYWTPWTKAYEEEGFADYCTFLRALVRRYKDRIKHWEIYNEPNIFFWSGPRERYPRLLKLAYDAVKAEDPEAQVLGCSTSGIDRPFIQMCLDAQAPFDALTIHPYRGALHEGTFMDELAAVRQQVGGRPVWITEMGWPTIPGNATERQQADRLARSYLSAIGSGASGNICWYDFRNDGWNPYYNEENFGITYQDLSPKPAYRALASVCRTFTRGTPAIERLPGGVFLFRMGGAAAVWADETPVTLALRAKGAPEFRNLMGEPLAAAQRDGGWLITTDAAHPVFILNAAVESATVVGAPSVSASILF
ncbi:MAG: beta-galactosidase [Verrucomicrobiota bacterium]|jgi:hypothetical protein|nr:beta-galactosidase [Verrucomicrobiota bacterium]